MIIVSIQMQHILKKILNDDEKINKLMKNEGFVQEHVNGGILTITPKYGSFLLEFRPVNEIERRDLTRYEIAEHVEGTKLTVEDAVQILKQLKKDSIKLQHKFDTISDQYSVLGNYQNPLWLYRSKGMKCPEWYQEKYDEPEDPTREYEPGEDSEKDELKVSSKEENDTCHYPRVNEDTMLVLQENL